MNTIETRTNQVLEDFTKEILLTPEFIDALPNDFIEQQLNRNGINHVVFFENITQQLTEKPMVQNWEKLSNWINGLFGAGWLPRQELLNVALARRHSPRQNTQSLNRIKIIDLQGKTVALDVQITPVTDQKMDISIRVYPNDAQYLPAGLQTEVEVYDELENLLLGPSKGDPLKGEAGSYADPMDLADLTCESGTKITVKLTLDNASPKEGFEI